MTQMLRPRGQQSTDNPQGQRASRLFGYLRELTQLRTKVRRTFGEEDEAVWFADIPRDDDCECIGWLETVPLEVNDVWLRIKKPHLSPVPEPKAMLEPWLIASQLKNANLELPALKSEISVPMPDPEGGEDIEERLALRDHPEISDAWREYVDKQWLPWARVQRQKLPVQRVYGELFSIYQKQQRLGEAFEVVVGVGMLHWRTPSGQTVQRHLITMPATVSFDPKHGAVSVGASADGAKLSLEQDMLEPSERPEYAENAKIEAGLQAAEAVMWDRPSLVSVLQAWVNSISTEGVMDETLTKPGAASDKPKVHFAPALILRKRSERSLVKLFDDISQQLANGADVPLGTARLVSVMDDGAGSGGVARAGGDGAAPRDSTIFFPLPSNAEQEEIVRKLETRQGVLVQGPPGTGKSHTIVNLVSHLLATGRRVLVTSHTARALAVLRDKFPTEIRDLCVLNLGDDATARQDLENSVSGITRRFDGWNQRLSEQDIADKTKKLDDARRTEATLLADLRAIRESETYLHPTRPGGYAGTAQAIAARLHREEPQYAWLKMDAPTGNEPPISNAEALEYLGLLESLSASDKAEVERWTPNLSELLTPEAFAAALNAETSTLEAAQALVAFSEHPAYLPLAAASAEVRSVLEAQLGAAINAMVKGARSGDGWAETATEQVLSGRGGTWRALLESSSAHLNAFFAQPTEASEATVTGIDGHSRESLRADARALRDHLAEGKGLGWGFLRPKPVQDGMYLVQEVKVNGRLCNAVEPLNALLAWLEARDHLAQLALLWKNHTEVTDGVPRIRAARFQELHEQLDRVLRLETLIADVRASLQDISGVVEPDLSSPEALEALRNAIRAANAAATQRAARATLDGALRDLEPKSLNPKAHEAVQRMVASIRERDLSAYALVHANLAALEQTRQRLLRREALENALGAVAPRLVETLRTDGDSALWRTRMGDFAAAWHWASTDRWLRELVDPEAQGRVLSRLDHTRTHARSLLGELAAAQAWSNSLSKMKEHERQKLIEWKQAVKRLGKGTGKYANHHREVARSALQHARTAIPAWIMPVYRVAESFQAGTQTFDVAIIDEASQSGPEALFLSYIADKIVVVGDDKQIKPESIGMDRDVVQLLKQRYLHDVPAASAIAEADTSFFEIAEVLFGGRLRLKEHFRCMPEIIQFSNNLCYSDDPLVPLKQFGAARLPPVLSTYVQEGYQSGSVGRVHNRPEAEAIVAQIVRCCQDEHYAGKSMGVISLLGEAQAKLIEQLLLSELGAEEINRRGLICGDAYAFQGDERDIVFLSLVSAPTAGQRIGVLAKASDERRFNVAASRAKEQMWLFHSATLSDLSPSCYRFRLLQYFLEPRVEQQPVGGLDVEQIEHLLQTADRKVPPPAPFDSWFEVEVFVQIARRGYRVIPQYQSNGFFIDLVVEGLQGRLAVECDGDEWHGPDRYEADMARQRVLERAGWQFWRVRGSTYQRDPQDALQKLWQKLEQLGIAPGGAQPAAGSAPTDHQPPLDARAVQEGGQSDLEPQPADAVGGDEEDLFGFEDEAEETLAPYRAWQPRPLTNPFVADPETLTGDLLEIVRAEGPVVCLLVYERYATAVGLKRTDPNLRALLDSSVRQAVVDGHVLERDEFGQGTPITQVLRLPNTPPVVVRERGDRAVHLVPPEEIRTVAGALIASTPMLTEDEEALVTALLRSYKADAPSDLEMRGLRAALKRLNSKKS